MSWLIYIILGGLLLLSLLGGLMILVSWLFWRGGYIVYWNDVGRSRDASHLHKGW